MSLFGQEQDSVIEYSSIVLHNEDVAVPSTLLVDNKKFGILKIKMDKVKITRRPLFILFSIDVTGSMGEYVNERSTKLDYVKQTFKNMLAYLAELEIDIYIKVNTFNVNVVELVKTTKLTTNNSDEIFEKIKRVYAVNSTDIGNALTSANLAMKEYIESNKNHQVAHIFMTDGEATIGEKNNRNLCDIVDESFPNVFVGFGLDHNANLLRKFSEKKMAEYQFVDNMENTSLIYGETIHRFLYPAITDITINIEDGVIYNWQTNEWTEQLYEDVFIGEIEKIYHIRTAFPESVTVTLSGATQEKEKCVLDKIYKIPALISIETNEILDNNEDLTKYLFRQQVLELLYVSRNLPITEYLSIISLKNDMKNCFREMRKYMRENNLLDDSFWKQLCDDIYITHKTIGTRVGNMYSTARQRSQGMQRAYTTATTPEDIIDHSIYAISPRSRSIVRSNAVDELDDFITNIRRPGALSIDIPPNSGSRTIGITRNNNGSLFTQESEDGEFCEDDELHNYVSADTNISCYSTPSAVNTMRSMSQHTEQS
jgi:hypothetical protein